MSLQTNFFQLYGQQCIIQQELSIHCFNATGFYKHISVS